MSKKRRTAPSVRITVPSGEEEEAEQETDDEEAAWADDECDALGRYLRDIGNSPLLSAEQEQALARRIAQGDQAARQQLIEANLRLVVKMATHYSSAHTDLLDLIQEGNIGLLRAVERFDPERGCRFSTYAVFWIRQALSLAVASEVSPLHLSVHTVEQIYKLMRVSSQLTQQLERAPLPHELAAVLSLSPEQVLELQGMVEPPTSLDLLRGENESCPKMQRLQESSLDRHARESRYGWLYSVLRALAPQERELLAQRYGLESGEDEQPEERPAEQVDAVQEARLARAKRAETHTNTQRQWRRRVVLAALQKVRAGLEMGGTMTCF